jgi:hypothetical protein
MRTMEDGSSSVPDPVTAKLNERPVRRLLQRFPKIFNSSMNKSFRQLGSSFYTQFGKERLRKGIFQVKRKFNRRASKAERAGFSRKQFGQKDLEKKGIRLFTRNPAAIARELGATIRPRKGEFVFIRGEFQGKSKKTQRAQAKFFGRQAKLGSGIRYARPIVAKKRVVRIAPKLGFLNSWRNFQPRRREIFLRGSRDAIRRAALRLGGGEPV